MGENIQIYADCANTDRSIKCPSQLFRSKRPDLAVVSGKNLTVLELTVCFETNTTKSRNYKKQRYASLLDELIESYDSFNIIFIEITALGFIAEQSYSSFDKFLRKLNLNADRIVYKCMETAVRASYYIFCRRGKAWSNPNLLSFY